MYAKIFRSLWDGTLADSWETWSTFVFLIAHADRDGVVEMTPGAIARRSCIPLEKVEAALAHLQEPDPASRSDAEEGRRLVPIDGRGWGWRIVNYGQYRKLKDADMVRAQTAERVQRFRVTHGNARVTQGNGSKRHAEGDVEVDAEEETPLASSDCIALGLPLASGDDFHPTEAEVREWEALYPGVEVSQQLRNMRGWLLSNRERRKTRRGVRKFITGWLAKEQDKGRRNGNGFNSDPHAAERAAIEAMPAVNGSRNGR